MLRKQKTREVGKNFAGSKTGHVEKIRWENDNGFFPAIQEKCARCPCFPGMGYACNLVPCPFTVRGACAICIHSLPVNEHRNKARCLWTGERLDAGDVERVRECIGFEERHFSASDLYPQNPQYPQNCLSEKKTGEGLTSAGVSGKVGFPKSVRGVAIAVSSSPTVKKVLPAYSAVEALTISSGRLSHIGGIITSRTREGLAVSDRLGSVVIPPLLFNPKLSEVPHV